MKIRLRTSAKHKFGQTNVLLHAGETKFDETGLAVVEIENEIQLQQLLQGVPDLSVVDADNSVLAPQTLTNNLGKAEANPGSVIGSEETNDLIKSLEGKSLEELQDYAVDFPKEAWVNLDEAGLKAYLIAQLSAE